jgi:hypothetical protein
VNRLRRYVTEVQSDECLLWIVQVVSEPHLAREEAALQRRMGRIPRDRPLLLKICDKHGFDNELVALQVERMTELPLSATGRGDARLEATLPYRARVEGWRRPAERPGRGLGIWLRQMGVWAGVSLLSSALLRSCS